MGRAARANTRAFLTAWGAMLANNAPWNPVQLRRAVEVQRLEEPFAVKTINGVLKGKAGDYLLRDPVSGFVTVLPGGLAISLFVNAPVEGINVASPQKESAS